MTYPSRVWFAALLGVVAVALLSARTARAGETAGVEPPAAEKTATVNRVTEPSAAHMAAAADQEAEPANPFAGFETHFLPNDVKVWFKHLPGAPNVSVSVGVPVGSDADPPGKEQLAHFTEHMLFSDHGGRTEQEIKDAVEALGGRRNGFTFRDHTWYYVTIGQEHGLFAIEWLAGILSPHEMDPAVVDRGRQPVENEVRARPRELFDHLWAALNPAWLAPPGFWEREFGIERLRAPFPDTWKSLQGITPDDLRGFYDQYYSPSVMTVTIVGDLDRDEALYRAEHTFGSLPARPANRWTNTAEDPERERATYQWGFQSTAGYQSRHKLFYATGEELLTAMFIRDLLNRRLNQRLRYGERKAVYGASASLVTRGPAAYLQIGSRIDEGDYDFAKAIIDEEIEYLRSGSLGAAEFESDRAALVERLRASNQTAESLNVWTRQVFYDPATFTDFPDVLSFYENLSQSRMASFAALAFDESRRVLSVTRTQPVSQGTMVLAVAMLVWITLKVVAWALTKPVRMKEIRYVAHFRLPVLLRTSYALGMIAAGLAAGRLAAVGVGWVANRWIAPTDDYVVQHAGIAGIFVLLLAGLAVFAAWPPRKLLIFSDHVRIKSRAWRSRILKAEDIEEITLRHGFGPWLSREVFRSPPLVFGLLRPGIHLRPAKGRSYFFRSRDTAELAQVLGSWWGRPVSQPLPKERGRKGWRAEGARAKGRPAPATVQATPAPATTGRDDTRGATTPAHTTGTTPRNAPGATHPASQPAAPGATSGSATRGVTSPSPPGPDPHEDIDFDSIGLTEAEMRELLGDDG